MTTQAGLQRSERLIPLYASIPIMLLAIAYATIMAKLGWHHGEPDWRGILAGFPFVGLWFYGSLVLLVETAHVDVDTNGVSIYYRPLPSGMKARRIAREEIAEITLDCIHLQKEGTFWRIGLGLADGRKFLLPERHNKEEEGRERVAAMKAILSGGVRNELPTGTIYTKADKKDWPTVMGIIVWGLAFLGAIIWGLVIEISRGHR
ncbi:MAG: hypothetical protein ABI972_03845 [Acidobacteriota bacterium]